MHPRPDPYVPVLDGPRIDSARREPGPERRLPSLHPTEQMRRAKGRLESLSDPPRADTELLAAHGWLAPDGTLYACAFKQHDALGRALGFEHESHVEGAGYCKLSNLEWLVSARYTARALTDAQWATIEAWYVSNDFPQAHFLRLVAMQ
jgi:hypothetical protein